MTEQLALVCRAANKRPTVTDSMRHRAAEQLVSEMVKSGSINKEDAAGSIEDIAKAIRWGQMDGYKIARELEDRRHWDCDLQMAEDLDQCGSILDAIYDSAEKQWAAENPCEQAFRDGDVVIWRGKEATVHGIYPYRPYCYEVRQGDMKRPNAYYVVPFEEVSAPT